MAQEPAVRASRYAKSAGALAQVKRLRVLGLRITYGFAFDRIVHNATWMEVGDINMRERLSGRKDG